MLDTFTELFFLSQTIKSDVIKKCTYAAILLNNSKHTVPLKPYCWETSKLRSKVSISLPNGGQIFSHSINSV